MIKLLFQLLDLICWVLGTAFFYKLLAYFVSPKNNKILKLITVIGSFYLYAVIIFPEDMINVVGALILFLLMILFCFEESIIQRIAVVLVLFPLIIAVNFLAENVGFQTYIALGGILLEDLGDAAFNSSHYAILDSGVHLFYTAIKGVFWYLLYRFLRRRLPNVKKRLTKKMWAMISVICLAPLSGIVSLVAFSPKMSVYIYLAMISSIVTIVGILLLTGYIASTVATEMENKNLRLQETYYEELEKSQRDTATLRHDMNNHLGVLGALFEAGDRQAAQDYYQNLSNELVAKNRLFCKNTVVNAVINAKYNQAIKATIDCFFNIDLGDALPIDDMSLCSIFANTLDNALEACMLMDNIADRSISLQARYVDRYFSYEISNSKENPIIEKNGIIKTDKEDQKNHGYGLASVGDIVESYEGVLGVFHTTNSFTLTILLKNL